MTEDRNARLPELLAPAGSAEALYAAVSAGADAVYFGVGAFNARMNAKNLAEGELAEAVAHCRRLGVKTYVTLNTQLYGGEVYAAAETARGLYNLGVDAFITADIGLARVLRSAYPEIEIHASTQMTGQNEMSAQVLSEMGFSRMVAPRELSLADIKALCEKVADRDGNIHPRCALRQRLGAVPFQLRYRRQKRKQGAVRPALPPAVFLRKRAGLSAFAQGSLPCFAYGGDYFLGRGFAED